MAEQVINTYNSSQRASAVSKVLSAIAGHDASTEQVSVNIEDEVTGDSDADADDDGNSSSWADEKPSAQDALRMTPPAWFQFGVLLKRFIKSMIRDPVAFTGELVQYVFMAVFMGMHQLPHGLLFVC